MKYPVWTSHDDMCVVLCAGACLVCEASVLGAMLVVALPHGSHVSSTCLKRLRDFNQIRAVLRIKFEWVRKMTVTILL